MMSMGNIIWRDILAVKPGMTEAEAKAAAKVFSTCRCDIIRRCTDTSCGDYPLYGGRGIKVCAEWLDPVNGAKDFSVWAMLNGWQPGLEIDRKDNNSGYSPDNCRWVSKVVNCFNRRSNMSINLDVPTSILRDMMPDKSGKQASAVLNGSRDEIMDALIHSRELRIKHRNEERDRLRHGLCPCCGKQAETIYRRRVRNGRVIPVGCPSCVSGTDTYAAAVEAGVFD